MSTKCRYEESKTRSSKARCLHQCRKCGVIFACESGCEMAFASRLCSQCDPPVKIIELDNFSKTTE